MVVAVAVAQQAWFYELAAAVAFALLFLNVLLVVGLHVRRMREWFRGQRARAFRQRVDEAVARLAAGRDPGWLRAEVGTFDELEGPIAAVALVEQLEPASPEERQRTLETLRDLGAVDGIVESIGRRRPWRRALAIRTLGRIGATEAVPVLLERLRDPNRLVREAAVRALGRIGDPRALPALAELHATPGPTGAGVVYDALVALGPQSATVFVEGLRSDTESVRIASCFGVATVLPPPDARPLLAPLLDDASPVVRAGAAEALAHVGGGELPAGLARAGGDPERSVRAAASGALGSFDDPRAVELAAAALADPDRETALRAAESLVRLAKHPTAGSAAAAALERAAPEWTVVHALAAVA